MENPKEEYKPNTCDIIFERASLIDIEEYKPETLEEAAREYYKRGQLGLEKAADTEKAFLRGAEWQQERMYSEEEVNTIARDAYIMGRNNILIGGFNKWFKQFKKK